MLISDLLKNKTAIITGSNRGIGKVIVELFACNGAKIYACARNETQEFKKFIEHIVSTYKVEIEPLYFDLSNESQIKESMKKFLIERRHIDILVNNAGIAYGGFLQMTSINKIKEVFEINFFSQMLIIQYISKVMISQKSGSIINMSSVVGIDSYPGYSAYGSSKAAFIFATKTLSKEFANYNIRINTIAPGLTETDMSNQMEKKAKEIMIKNNAMNRLAKPEEIANMALFLASDLSSFITGQVLRIDGGMQ